MRQILNNDLLFSLLRSAVAVIFMLVMVIILLQPQLETIAGVRLLYYASKYHLVIVGHVLTFFVMFFLWAWALIPHFRASAAPVIACLIVLTLAIVSEFLQSYIPMRYSSTADMTANVLGIALAWWTWQSMMQSVKTHLVIAYP